MPSGPGEEEFFEVKVSSKASMSISSHGGGGSKRGDSSCEGVYCMFDCYIVCLTVILFISMEFWGV